MSLTLTDAVDHVIAHKLDTFTARTFGVDVAQLREAFTRLERVSPPLIEGATPSGYRGSDRMWVTRQADVGAALATYLVARGLPLDVSVAAFLASEQ